jgi:hypothetical protein
MTKFRHGWYNIEQGVLVLPRDDVFDASGKDLLTANVDIYDIDAAANQRYPVGTQLRTGYNLFRYCEFGETTAAGDVVDAEAPDGAHDDLNPTGTGTNPFNNGVAVSNAAGATVFSFSDSLTLVVNEYTGGWCTIETDTGQGYSYPILRNTVAAGAANGAIEIQFGLAVAIDSTSDVKLNKQKYKEVVQGNVTQLGRSAGVSVAIGADNSFGWLCTGGPWAVLTAGTAVVGDPLSNISTAGAVGPWAAVTTPLLGHT